MNPVLHKRLAHTVVLLWSFAWVQTWCASEKHTASEMLCNEARFVSIKRKVYWVWSFDSRSQRMLERMFNLHRSVPTLDRRWVIFFTPIATVPFSFPIFCRLNSKPAGHPVLSLMIPLLFVTTLGRPATTWCPTDLHVAGASVWMDRFVPWQAPRKFQPAWAAVTVVIYISFICNVWGFLPFVLHSAAAALWSLLSNLIHPPRASCAALCSHCASVHSNLMKFSDRWKWSNSGTSKI